MVIFLPSGVVPNEALRAIGDAEKAPVSYIGRNFLKTTRHTSEGWYPETTYITGFLPSQE